MSNLKFIGIIPARYASTRFPGKPLAMLGGKYVIERVWHQVRQVFDTVVVATDDERIASAVESFGGTAIMTSPNHRSGTDRCYEAYLKAAGDEDVVINIQGDEPFIQPEQLHAIMNCFDDAKTEIATLVKPFDASRPYSELENPNAPKVVIDKNYYAHYFSRSVIPFIRNAKQEEWPGKNQYYTHIGMYAYRANILAEITKLPQSQLELAESLEQLRWLENGYSIKVGISNTDTIGIDTPEDLKKAEKFLKSNRH
jgi:3-deoxy-manno-octulosonate cytidylyltransferase (CMP-KDO synthetase)